MGNIPQHMQKQQSPSTFSIKGVLRLTVEGSEEPIELGEIDIPIEVNVGTGKLQQGPVYRGVPSPAK